MFFKVRELYRYRQMLQSLVLTDLRTRYKGSFLGFLWTFINPLLMLMVYSMLFSTIMRIDIKNYPIFLFIGLLPWIYFSTSVQNSSGIVIRHASLVKKIYFPRIVLPLSSVGAALINYLLSLGILVPALYLFGYPLSKEVIYFPLILLVQTILSLGLSIFVSSINVFFRDVEHILGILLTVWFYYTPIIYTRDLIPEEYLGWFTLNPLLPIMEAYQGIFYHHMAPDISALLQVGFFGVILLVLSTMLFQHQQKKFAEET